MSNRELGLTNNVKAYSATFSLIDGTIVSNLPGYSSGLSQITSITRTVVGGVPGAINVVLGATTAAVGPITTAVSLFSTNIGDTSTFVINYLTKVA